MITIVGGKWTTTRHMAEETIDALSQIIHKTSSCTTKEMLLTGSNEKKGKLSIDEICGVLRKEYDLPRDICLHLATTYGYKAYQVWKSLGREERVGGSHRRHGEPQESLECGLSQHWSWSCVWRPQGICLYSGGLLGQKKPFGLLEQSSGRWVCGSSVWLDQEGDSMDSWWSSSMLLVVAFMCRRSKMLMNILIWWMRRAVLNIKELWIVVF